MLIIPPTCSPKDAAVFPSEKTDFRTSRTPPNALSNPAKSIRDVMPSQISITRSAITVNPDEKLLIAPEILACPIWSITFPIDLPARFCIFSAAVPIPSVAVRACSSKEAKPLTPSLLSLMTALLKSSIVTLPFLRASYKSVEFFVGPSKACATWLSCPGITSCKVRQSLSSTLPRESICVYCCIALV